MTNKILVIAIVLLSLVLYAQNKEYRRVQIENNKLSEDIKTVRSVAVELKSLEMMMSDENDTCLEEDSLMDALPNEVAVVDTEVYKDPYEQTLDSILSVTSKYVTKN
jgi:DNA-directed RNA polymerase sigma subunit (sigma70/sigma32)